MAGTKDPKTLARREAVRRRNPEAFDTFRANRLARLRAKHKEAVRLAAVKAAEKAQAAPAEAQAAPAEAQGDSARPSIERDEPEPVSWKGTPLPKLRWSAAKKRPFERAGAPSPVSLAKVPTQAPLGGDRVTVPEVALASLHLSDLPQNQNPEGRDALPSQGEGSHGHSMFPPSFSLQARVPAPKTKKWRPWE